MRIRLRIRFSLPRGRPRPSSCTSPFETNRFEPGVGDRARQRGDTSAGLFDDDLGGRPVPGVARLVLDAAPPSTPGRRAGAPRRRSARACAGPGRRGDEVAARRPTRPTPRSGNAPTNASPRASIAETRAGGVAAPGAAAARSRDTARRQRRRIRDAEHRAPVDRAARSASSTGGSPPRRASCRRRDRSPRCGRCRRAVCPPPHRGRRRRARARRAPTRIARSAARSTSVTGRGVGLQLHRAAGRRTTRGSRPRPRRRAPARARGRPARRRIASVRSPRRALPHHGPDRMGRRTIARQG